jgi:hypothetical protein
MALTHPLPNSHGIDIQNGYWRISHVELIDKFNMIFEVRGYANPDKHCLANISYSCQYDITSENPIRQAYLHLKTLPEFATATDC